MQQTCFFVIFYHAYARKAIFSKLEFPQIYSYSLNFTSNTYQMKRKILTFTNKISKVFSKLEKKFTTDITYGMLASGSFLLTDVADQLHEPSPKINIVDRLSRHLQKTFTKKVIMSQRHVCLLAVTTLPAFFPEYTLLLKKTISLVNTITFQAMAQGAALFGKAAFCMDRGHDNNKMFLKLEIEEQRKIAQMLNLL